MAPVTKDGCLNRLVFHVTMDCFREGKETGSETRKVRGIPSLFSEELSSWKPMVLDHVVRYLELLGFTPKCF